MEIVLWVFAGFIALFFMLAGAAKLLQSRELFYERTGNRAVWVTKVSDTQFLLIGAFEFCAGAAVFIFRFFDSIKFLSFVASGLLALTMLLAIMFHISFNDKAVNIVPASSLLSINLIYLLLNSLEV